MVILQTLLTILIVWFLISIPVSLLTGAFFVLKGSSEATTVAEEAEHKANKDNKITEFSRFQRLDEAS